MAQANNPQPTTSPSSDPEKPSTSSDEPEKRPHRAQAGATWKAHEQHVLPKNNLPVVFSGIALAVFLAALDQVGDIVSQSYPARH